MFVRLGVLLLSLVLASCTPIELIRVGAAIAGVERQEDAKLRNCSGPDVSDWICRKDAQKLARDVNARVCKSNNTHCRYVPIEEAASFESFCFGNTVSQDCWFEGKNS